MRKSGLQMGFDKNKILIVEDETPLRIGLARCIERTGYVALQAADGPSALEMVGKHMPGLVILDVMMHGMSGIEVCRKLKEDPATRTIPVMMVTALNELGDIERGVESGTDDFVTKPVNKLELITRVKSLLRVRHLKRELDRTMAYIQSIDRSRPHGQPGPSD